LIDRKNKNGGGVETVEPNMEPIDEQFQSRISSNTSHASYPCLFFFNHHLLRSQPP